jgi:pyridoxamine 5'-phosphate oxidase
MAKVRFDTPMSANHPEGTSREAQTRSELNAMRRSYGEKGITDLGADPLAAFTSWLHEAADNPFIIEANAMVLSTLGSAGDGSDAISSRTVLLKDISQGGFTFFTNYNSRKAQAIYLHSQVTMLFPWYAMERQVAISGFASQIERSESETYFATRPWSSQIGAWASAQSSPLSSREELEQRYEGAAAKWPEGTEVPCPPHWGGFRVLPISIEFWQGRYSRLHDRLRYERENTDSHWEINRYYP